MWLFTFILDGFACLGRIDTYGLPSLSSTTPLGRLASGNCSSLVGSGIEGVDTLRRKKSEESLEKS